ncbi:FAD-binding protein [Rhodococcus rhodnii]|uniref:L-gulonolactone oxidase n=2 Tax=Rhodococcus rhodnii TaxID=38312 RepID=R7WPW3_9NOCA|nr:D-arabinono-1,4-lactone oxidase [Rhodococcus rhodnii]EOM77357.1 L-gulonolactone oxidase [Rhodococcus rhodnii LMG 5362]TXG91728.1 FAD-binding protein [Rhodococcus rhodnii]
MQRETWTNWARTETAHPRRIATPASVTELAALVADAAANGLRVKAVGSGHSFTGAAVTDGILVSLDRLTGIDAVTPTDDGAHVTVWAGTRLRALNEALWERGYAMRNLGDIDAQSIAGAIATGTHGTGARFGGLATMVAGLEMVLPDGAVVWCSPTERPELFEAARIGLGALGVVTRVVLDCTAAYAMHAAETSDSLDATLERLDEDRTGVDHFEFYWFPHTRRVLTKRNTRLPVDTPLAPVPTVSGYISDELLSNVLFEGINRFTTALPQTIPAVNSVTARVLGSREFTDRSYRVFASSRRVRFREMEYAVPAETLTDVLAEIEGWIGRTDYRVAFPVEVRFAAADDVWLSTAHGRETAYVAVHQYHRRDHTSYFRAVEDIARAVDGRPHWGKLHGRTRDDLRTTYPRFDDVVAVRDDVDPQRTFGNEYLERVLG